MHKTERHIYMIVKDCPCEDDVRRTVYAKYFCLEWQNLRIPAWHHTRNGTGIFEYRTSRRVLGFITSHDRGLVFVRDKNFDYSNALDLVPHDVLVPEVLELCGEC